MLEILLGRSWLRGCNLSNNLDSRTYPYKPRTQTKITLKSRESNANIGTERKVQLEGMSFKKICKLVRKRSCELYAVRVKQKQGKAICTQEFQ